DGGGDRRGERKGEGTQAVTNITQRVALKPVTTSPTPTPGASPTTTPSASSIVIAAVGDMHCTTSDCQGVGIDTMIAQIGPAAFFPDGDQVFSNTASNFNKFYDPSFGQFKSISHPAIGNYDGLTVYYDYWNGAGNSTGRAGPRNKGWYSFSKGSWQFVVLNSNCISGNTSQVSCQPGSEQINWLQSDLASHSNKCTIAFMHIPYYTSGSRQFPALQAIFQTLYDHHVDVLITGHIHDYQRFYPQDGSGNQVADGVTEFVVGTGGGTLASAGNTPTAPNEAVLIGHAFGVLKMNLLSGSYNYQFLPAPGSSGSDSGSGTCH
ncbi:MAG TPA: metallophosphoesterase, partial [Anaerolineales bacterium]|nr:metallophosphoesterase [Anaerolineales bacterium]